VREEPRPLVNYRLVDLGVITKGPLLARDSYAALWAMGADQDQLKNLQVFENGAWVWFR
jgi:hypothetical protein